MYKYFCVDFTDSNCLQSLLHIHQLAIQQGIYRRSFKVAFVVGTMLNIVNQPQAMLEFLFLDFPAMERINLIRMLLTYTVPFLVTSYGALTAIDLRQNPTQADQSREPSNLAPRSLN